MVIHAECVNLNLAGDSGTARVFWAYCLMSFGSLLAFLAAVIFWGEDSV